MSCALIGLHSALTSYSSVLVASFVASKTDSGLFSSDWRLIRRTELCSHGPIGLNIRQNLVVAFGANDWLFVFELKFIHEKN